jgi:uridine kinase
MVVWKQRPTKNMATGINQLVFITGELNMVGDIILVEEHHRHAAQLIVQEIGSQIMDHPKRYSITVAGESGSGKSETAHAIADELQAYELKSIVLGQDDYFNLPPKLNDAKRRANPDWLGPHLEVNIPVLQKNIDQSRNGAVKIIKPLIDYDQSVVGEEEIDISDIQVIITEGTYTSLLKNIDTKVFIARNRIDTLAHRKKRNRGNEVHDPFIENILKTEHKIIAGHIFLSDYIITKDYKVERSNGALH